GHGLSVDSIEVIASVGSRLSARIARFLQSRDRSSPMTQPISPLRQRMIDDMTMRNLSAKHPRDVHPFGRAVQCVPPAITGQARGQACAEFSPASCIARRGGQLHRREDGGAALLLWHDLAAAGYRRGDSDAPPAGSFADVSCPRGGRATAQGGGRSQAANGAHDNLFGRFAHLRGYAAHGTGYRQRAHGDLRAARQRAQGSLYGPVRPAARYSSRLLASDTAIALAVSRPQSGPAYDQAGVATGLPARGRGRRAEQVGHGPHVATQFCDPPA